MTKYVSLKIYGGFILIAGLSLIIFPYFLSEIKIDFVAICMLISALFAFITAYKSQHKQSRFKYHEIHGVGMTLYGIAILLSTFYDYNFLQITAFYFIYYGLAEMIFCFLLFNLRSIIGVKILIIRVLTGIVIYVVAGMLMFYIDSYKPYAIFGDGILFIIIGIHTIFYLPIVKKLDVPISSIT
jgi:hypothetical protein